MGWRRLCRHSGPRSAGEPGSPGSSWPREPGAARFRAALCLRGIAAGPRGPRPSRRRLCPREARGAGHGWPSSPPALPHVPLPASPSSPIPHLAALVQQRQPLVGLGVGVRPLLLWHLRGPLPDTCHGHPGEMLPPDGAALLGVATPGLWPQKSPHRADPLSQWPLGTMRALVTKAWRSPWRRPCPSAGSPLGTRFLP